MKQSASDFQNSFFDYQIPAPLTSVYEQEFVRSNDLRLLLQIATKSNLRMFTDSKTGNLHFICKQKGSICFDIEAEPHPMHGYYFTHNYLLVKHKGKCHQENQALSYLTIYNLMKLKKKLIEEYMIKLKAEKESPSLILSKLTNTQEYFFQKYVNGHLEYKRKLRKRFDNIVNIDIKKIGKVEEEEQMGQHRLEIKQSQKKKKKQTKVTARAKARTKKLKLIAKGKISKKKFQEEQKLKFFHLSRKQNLTPLKKEVNQQQKCLATIQSNKIKQQEEEIDLQLLTQKANLDALDALTDKIKQEDEELHGLEVLNEQAQFFWSDSEEEQSSQKGLEINMANITNWQDYFKSLRNSTLKQSLEKLSLAQCFFSLESKTEKENAE